MRIETSITLQGVLLGLAFVTTVLRCYTRIVNEHRFLTIPDYLVWAGWLSSLGWVVCSIVALNIQIDHPLAPPELTTDSMEYLKTVFVACYCFDVGLYFPKASLVAFYWWLIPSGFRRLRIAVYITAAYLACSFLATMLVDTLIAPKISDNWSIENQLDSTWNSYNALCINWVLNWSTDILLFALPFFILNCLKLRKPQKLALCGVFSLGGITILLSLARFIVYTSTDNNIDDASGNLWCTAEITAAVIIVSLPSLKPLIMRSHSANNSYGRNTSGYINAESGNVLSGGHGGTNRSHVAAKKMSDDEIELVFQGAGKPSPSSTRAPSTNAGGSESKDGVIVTTNVMVTRDVL